MTLSDKQLRTIFDGEQSTGFDRTYTVEDGVIAGLRAVEAAVRADQIEKDAAIVKVSLGSQWGIAAAIRAYLIEGNTDE